MNTLTTFVSSMIFLVLFSIAIIGFAIGFANDTGAEVSVTADLGSYKTSAEGDLNQFDSESDDTYESISKSTVEPGSDVFQSSAPFTITFGNILGVAKNIINLPRKFIFGSDSEFSIFFNVFLAFLTFILILLGYKAFKGNP